MPYFKNGDWYNGYGELIRNPAAYFGVIKGYRRGYSDGYEDGYEDGFDDGYACASQDDECVEYADCDYDEGAMDDYGW